MMFKISGPRDRWWNYAGILVSTLWLAGCNTVRPLPPVNLAEPDWRVRQGQAVWRPNREAPELAGELLVAVADGKEGLRAVVQFTKTPFPVLLGQDTGRTWELRLPTENRRYSGCGRAPKRLIWLHLPSLLAGEPPPKGWSWTCAEGTWRVENQRTGEFIEGFLAP